MNEWVLAACCIVVMLFSSCARAKTYRVSDLEALQKLCAETANPGDVIELQPGVHYLTTPCLAVLRSGEPGRPITIRGAVKDGLLPVIDASRASVNRGIFRTEATTHDVVFEDLELRQAWGTRFADRKSFGTNAGAIYFQGQNLTARRIHTHHNENGWFATHNADHVLIENCEIDHNGTLVEAEHNHTHNFYFGAHHQTIRNCYIHHSGEAQNFKSRGWNTVFAYNWVEEDGGYSVEVASDNEGNTLWLGNVIIKRTAPGGQRRLLGFGDGTGVAAGTLTLINNTLISTTDRDIYLFTVANSTGDVVLINNVFAGPSRHFVDRNGQGAITGTHNWFPQGTEVPASVRDSLFGADPGFVDAARQDFRPRPGSPLANAGVPRPQFLNEHQQLEGLVPECEPSRSWERSTPRRAEDALSLGAFAPAETDR